MAGNAQCRIMATGPRMCICAPARNAVTIALQVVLWSANPESTAPQPTDTVASISIDFGVEVGAANGESSAVQQEMFVNATAPAASMLLPLKIVRYRGHEILSKPENFARLQSVGVRDMHYILADDPAWAHKFPPADWAAWERFVNETVSKAVAAGKGAIQWEPWNEPDLDWFSGFARPYRGNESDWLRMWELTVPPPRVPRRITRR